jgi:drug/metabolite transporter (DMT)-like permease
VRTTSCTRVTLCFGVFPDAADHCWLEIPKGCCKGCAVAVSKRATTSENIKLHTAQVEFFANCSGLWDEIKGCTNFVDDGAGGCEKFFIRHKSDCSEGRATYAHWVDKRLLEKMAPGLFVLLWSTGFIVARYGTKDAGPLTFLTIRTAIASVILFVVSRIIREARVSRQQVPIQLAVGIGIHAMYLGGVFVAINHGLPSGISALIAALHPVVTTTLSRLLLNEKLSSRQAFGVVLGCAGVVAVVIEHGGAGDGVTSFALCSMAVAVVGMSAGTLIQRKYAQGTPLLAGTSIQYLVTAVVLGACVVFSEGWQFTVTTRSVLSLAWAVGVLSIAAILIMLWLLRRQAAAQVSSLFFLTPALSTIEGAVLFGERLGVLAIAGLAVAIVGVRFATSQQK